MPGMDNDQAIRSLAGIRMAIGTSAWATPRAGRQGVRPRCRRDNPQSPYLARLFGVRDLALGIGALTTKRRRRAATG